MISDPRGVPKIVGQRSGMITTFHDKLSYNFIHDTAPVGGHINAVGSQWPKKGSA
jgi:hypothetical protein